MTEQVKAQAVAVRAALEASGLDHGPISVHAKMRAMGLASVPSTASLARIFQQAGVDRAGAEEEAALSVPAVRLSGAEHLLAARRRRVHAASMDVRLGWRGGRRPHR